MAECAHNCKECGEDCAARETESMLEQPHAGSHIRKVVAVVSGKGGVGKSLVTSMLAVNARRRGQRVAILDADITGPSIPKAFGLREKARGSEEGIYPAASKTGIGIMSVNLLLEDERAPVIWRGPIIAGTVRQFWTDVIWGTVDCLFIDMPPGTGDVPLTVFQSIPVDGIVVVTSPQELVSMIVSKAVRMAEMMEVPIIGIVENMSYFECPDCGKRHTIFGESNLEEIAAQYGISQIARLPIDPRLAAACDRGAVELFENDGLDALTEAIEAIPEKRA